MPISSCRSSSPRPARYSIGSGLKTDAYTSAIASVSAARRSRFVPGVREEEALVLAGERGAEAVLEEARAAHDDRPALEVVEHVGEPAQDVRREEGVLEELDDVRVVEPHPVGVDVLAAVDVLEVVVVDEVEDAVRRDVPAAGQADLAEQSPCTRASARRSARRGRARPPCRRAGRGCAAGRRCAGSSSWKSESRRYSFAMFTNSSWSVRKRRTSAARRPIWVATERSSSSTPPWRKRWSASASSASGVSMRSSAFFRKRRLVLLDPALDAVEDLVLAAGGAPAIRNAASVVSGSAARPARGPRAVVVADLLVARRPRGHGRAQQASRPPRRRSSRGG